MNTTKIEIDFDALARAVNADPEAKKAIKERLGFDDAQMHRTLAGKRKLLAAELGTIANILEFRTEYFYKYVK
jgi:hypothetical protein